MALHCPECGFTNGEGANYWSNKPQNGYLYASNRNGTLELKLKRHERPLSVSVTYAHLFKQM